MLDKENFRRLLEENISFLQRRIFNLEDYVPRSDFEILEEENENLKSELEKVSNEKSQLETDKNNLKRQVDNLSRERNFLSCERDNLHKELSNLQGKLEEFDKIADECNYYRKYFAAIDSAYKKYLSVNENIRYNLAGIFGDGSTIQGFLFGAANEKHLNEFWEYLRYSINDGRLSEEEQNNLASVFDFCFDALNQSSRDKIFVRLETEIGSRFDNRTMVRTSDSKQLGTVKKVLLEGYTNRVGNVVQPSLVFIDD